MKIKVTKQNIKEGLPRSPASCPVACALSQIFGCIVEVYPDKAIFINAHTYRKNTVSLPRNVSIFIDNFDDGKKVKPFEFNL